MKPLSRVLNRAAGHGRRSVEVRLPLGFGLGRPVRGLFAERSAELGLSASPTVSVEESWEKTATVSIDGRPLMVGAPPGDLFAMVDRALLRRLSLLAGPEPVLGYLLDHGVSIEGAADAPEMTRPQDEMSAAEQGELLLERLAPASLEFEVDSAVLRRVDDGSADALVRERVAFFSHCGVQFPDVRLVPTDRAARLRLNHVRLSSQVPSGAGWPDAVAALRRSLDEHAHWFVRMSDVVTALGRLSYLGPDLVAMATDRYPATLLTACLRELVREGASIRNLPRILWLLLEMGSGGGGSDQVRLSEAPLPGSGSELQRDPVLLASGIRKAVAEERWRVGRATPVDGARLPLSVEQALLAGSPDAEWEALKILSSGDMPRSIITRTTAALRPVRDVLQALPDPPKVVASQELPPDVAVRVI